MTCAEFQNRLSAFLDGEMSHWKRWKVQNHIRTCMECADLMRELESVDQCLIASVQETAQHSPGREYLTAAVMRRLPAMPPASFRPRHGVRAWTAGVVLAGLQVAALGGAYWWGFSHGQHRGGASSGTAALGPGSFFQNDGAHGNVRNAATPDNNLVRSNTQNNGPVTVAPFAEPRPQYAVPNALSNFNLNSQQLAPQPPPPQRLASPRPARDLQRLKPRIPSTTLQPSGG